MHLLKSRTLTMYLVVPAVLLGLTTLCSAQITGFVANSFTVSNANPTSSEPVTLSVTVQGGPSAWQGTVYFFEDQNSLTEAPNTSNSNLATTNPPIYGSSSNNNESVILGIPGDPNFYKDAGIPVSGSGSGYDTATLTTQFMGGTHQVYAYVQRTDGSGHNWTTSPVTINVTAAIAVPAKGVYLGATADSNADLEAAESTYPNGIGRPYALNIEYFSGDGGEYTPFNQLAGEYTVGGFPGDDKDLPDDLEYGRIPTISWACDSGFTPTGTENGAYEAIINWDDSQQDITTIQHTALALKEFGAPVMLRLNWEFNISSNNDIVCAGGTNSTEWTPPQDNNFIGAWQTVWQIFQQEGATNVVFDWNPGHWDPTNDNSRIDPSPLYPGDTFVDWIGVDSYQDSNWTWGFSDVIAGANGDRGDWYDEFKSHNKPMMIGETGAYNDDYDGCTLTPPIPSGCPPYEVQGPYITSITDAFDTNSFPLVHAVEWFDEMHSFLNYNDDEPGLAAMNNLGGVSTFFQAGLQASAPPPTTDVTGNSYSMPLSLSNTGLIPLTSVEVSSITVNGNSSVTPPTGPILFTNPNLTQNELSDSVVAAGQTATAMANFTNWPPTATCVNMTINYSYSQSNDGGGSTPETGSNTITAARVPGANCQ